MNSHSTYIYKHYGIIQYLFKTLYKKNELQKNIERILRKAAKVFDREDFTKEKISDNRIEANFHR